MMFELLSLAAAILVLLMFAAAVIVVIGVGLCLWKVLS
jgi:hypothetical protein